MFEEGLHQIVTIGEPRVHIGSTDDSNKSNHVLNTFSDVSSGVLNGWIAVNVWEESQTETIVIIGRICEAIDNYGVCLCVKYFTHSWVQLIVGNRAPVLRLLVCNLLHVWRHICCVHWVVVRYWVVLSWRVRRRRSFRHFWGKQKF